MKAGVLYQCFMSDDELNNRYVEVLLDRSVGESELEEIALTRLGCGGSLCSHASELLELTKANKAYVISLLVTAARQPQQLIETSIRGNRNGYGKILDAADWLTGTRAVTLTPLGGFTTTPATTPSEARKPAREPISYLEMRLLSAVKQKGFHNYTDLVESVSGGSPQDMSEKGKCTESLVGKGFMGHAADGVIRLTEAGKEALGQLEAPIDLEEEDALEHKAYPTNSGVPKLTSTANTVLCILQVEKQLTKAKLKKIVSAQKIPDVFGSVGKAVDKLADMGLVLKHETDLSYSEMPDLSMITLISKKTSKTNLNAIRKNPADYIKEATKECESVEYPGPKEKRHARGEALMTSLKKIGVEVDKSFAIVCLTMPEQLTYHLDDLDK